MNFDLKVEIPRSLHHFMNEDARFLGAYGGRAGAKSHGMATCAILRCVKRPLRILCLREVQLSIASSIKQLLWDKICAFGFQGHFTETQKEIVYSNGSEFHFVGMKTNLDSLKSKEGYDIAIIEEAQSVSQQSLDKLMPTMRKKGSQIWAVWNPENETDPIDKLLRGATPPPRSIIKKVSWRDNPFLPEESKEQMEWDKARDFQKYLHIWEGEYLNNSERRVFNNWTIEDFETPEGIIKYMGADWGFSVDPTTLISLWVDDEKRKIYIDYEAYKIGCEIDKIKDLFDTVPLSRKTKIIADSARPETISFVKREGFNILSAEKGAGSVEDGIEFIKSYDVVIHPRCVHTIDEFKNYSFKVDTKTNEVTTVLKDDKNHIIDAIRYALERIMKRRKNGGFVVL
jgi:phage terminase large subunit